MGSMLVPPVLFADGSATAPSIRFRSAGATGFFRTGSSIAVTIKGVEVSRWASTGAQSVTGGITSTSPTLGIGYATGAGGAVTQITSIATTVVLDKVSGTITTVAATTAAAAEDTFQVTNSTVAATDTVVVSTTYAGAGLPLVYCSRVAAGSFRITISNLDAAAALNAVLVINFAVLKGVSA